MRQPRITTAGLMITVVWAAAVLTVYRLASFLGLVALVPFGITMLIARLGPNLVARRRALWAGALGTLVFPFFAAIWINHELWGYYVRRPPVDRRIVDALQVESLTSLDSVPDARGTYVFTGTPIGEVDRFIQVDPHEGDYYLLEGRVLRALKDRQALPTAVRGLPPGLLGSLYRVLDDTGRLEVGEPGYPRAKELRGVAVQAVGSDGRPLVFVGGRGREVSNDHYPYYEFLLTGDSHGGPYKLLSFRRFYYDVAGIEGLEWPAFFLSFAFIGLIPTLPVQGFFIWCGHRRS